MKKLFLIILLLCAGLFTGCTETTDSIATDAQVKDEYKIYQKEGNKGMIESTEKKVTEGAHNLLGYIDPLLVQAVAQGVIKLDVSRVIVENIASEGSDEAGLAKSVADGIIDEKIAGVLTAMLAQGKQPDLAAAQKMEEELIASAGYSPAVGGYPIAGTNIKNFYGAVGMLDEPPKPGEDYYGQDAHYRTPCDYTDKNGHGSHIIYSDDHGKSWQLGGSVSGGCNECQVVELADGRLMLNMRMQENGQGKRGVATSRDGGVTWSELKLDPVLIEPVCQASLLRYTLASTGGKNRLLFSNPASAPAPGQSRGDRVKMTVRLSHDEGRTWPVSKCLHDGPSAYSCLAALPDGDIGCLYEGGKTRYGEIVFARFSLEWLTDGQDHR